MKNTGKNTIYYIMISDDHIGNGKPFEIANNLRSGRNIIYKKIYSITSDDLTKGSVTNIAYATGTYSSKTVKSNEATATVTSTAKPPDTSIPEFPSIALPVAAVLGLMFISQRRRKEN